MFLSKIKFFLLLLCNKFILSSLQTDRCSPEYCNFAGDCRIVNNKPNCSCYTEVFYGKYCENVKNPCLNNENQCTREQFCIPYVGQTICRCKRRSSGSSCTGPENTRPLLSHNFRAFYGVREFIILSFEKLGSADMEITVSTPNYMIGYVDRYTAETSQHTKNLTAILESLGIRRHMNIPYDDAQYYVFQATYFTLGANKLTTIIKSFNTSDQTQPQHVQNFSVIVYVASPRAIDCTPQITLPHTDPMNPKEVFVERFTNIQAILEKRCSPATLRARIHWTISSFDERIIYYYSEGNQRLLLKIPRYALWYNDLVKQFPNLLLSVRISFAEKTGASINERCYIKVMAQNLEARIAGGSFRTVAADQAVLFDGSQSREPGRQPLTSQHLMFTWVLSNIDGSAEQVLSQEGGNSTITIAGTNFKMNVQKRISLTVTNKFSDARRHTTSQVIQVVSDYKPLKVVIECVKNCAFDVYNPEQVLHLRAICKDCGTKLQYLWTVNAVDMEQDKKRFVKKLDSTLPNTITIEVWVSNRVSKGVARLQFQKAEQPTGGQCKMDPQDGVACETNFHIKCTGYKTINQQPISYKFCLGPLTEDFNYSGETTIRLYGDKVLTISICGTHSYCKIEELKFTVIPLSNVSSSQKVLELLNMGNRQAATCLQQEILMTKNLSKISDLYKTIGTDTSRTLLEASNAVEIADMLAPFMFPILSFNWFIIMNSFATINKSMEYIIADTEILDIEESTVLNIIVSLTQLFSRILSQKNTNLRQELINGTEDPYNESYLYLNRFDASVAMQVFRFSQYMHSLQILCKSVGFLATRFIVPEQPYEYITNGSNCRLEMHDEYTPINYTSNCTNCHINVPLNTVLGLRKLYKSSQLLLQAWCFDKDVMWWSPELLSPSTSVITAFLIGKSNNYQPTMESQFDYHISLRNNPVFIRNPYRVSDEVLRTMKTYKVEMKASYNLVINFVESTTRLQVLITMNREPTLTELKLSNCFVPKGGRNKTIVLRNKCEGNYYAYIAIDRANVIDTSHCEYTFLVSGIYCAFWGRSKNEIYEKWIRKGCLSENLKQSSEYSKCLVHHLSTFSAREYPLQPIPVKHRHSHKIHELNFISIFFSVFLFVGGLLLIFLTSIRSKTRDHNLIRVIKTDQDAEPASMENVIVHLRTGGMLLATTTANIKLVFVSDLGRYKVIIYQNPIKPHLKMNTSCTIRLSEERVKLPCRLTISHDISGRYTAWYCRTIQIDDLRQDISYTFKIHCWIKRNHKIRVSCYPHEMSNPRDYGLYQMTYRYSKMIARFRYYCRFYYINWFWMQPILGPWRYNDNSSNICERTSIWVSKTMLTVVIVFCYYGTSSDISVELGISGFFALSIGSYFANIVFDLFLTYLLRR